VSWRPTTSLWRLATTVLWLLLGLLVAAALLHGAGVRDWPFELVHHFVPHLTAGAAALALAGLLTKRRRAAALAVLLSCLFALAWGSAPLVPARPSPAAGAATGAGPGTLIRQGSSLTLLTHNVYVLNRQQDALLAWLTAGPADVVALQEVNPRLIERLRRAEDGYPWRMIAEDEFISGRWRSSEAIAILSRYPIVDERRLEPWAKGWQTAFVRLELPDGVRPWIVAVHAPSPLYADNQPIRDLILQHLAPVVAALEPPVIVLGDFNATPFTPAFRAFVAAAGLSTDQGLPATYPARAGALGLAIDHVLVRGADLLRLQALPGRGSDHRALTATVVLPAPG